ncbi:hypothetical protein MOO45_04905 [Bombilactobacillus folatiphilus]|uniref:Uncharacterized protein n=1 Tax=Bombilactobacillus folatiphilus TaxID=2923362 RepID=A0ABY4P7K1_9LACO|nr:hypothetical protein [Bombilactobacillus folatiphilus]UQS81565.1 hypothetical protein MOO45_04905 [Bombilactobacillus folatiphilus]
MFEIITFDYDEDAQRVLENDSYRAWIDPNQVAVISELHRGNDGYFNLILNGDNTSYVIDLESAQDILKFKEHKSR